LGAFGSHRQHTGFADALAGRRDECSFSFESHVCFLGFFNDRPATRPVFHQQARVPDR
jgi:hypothetical protein